MTRQNQWKSRIYSDFKNILLDFYYSFYLRILLLFRPAHLDHKKSLAESFQLSVPNLLWPAILNQSHTFILINLSVKSITDLWRWPFHKHCDQFTRDHSEVCGGLGNDLDFGQKGFQLETIDSLFETLISFRHLLH